MIVYEPFNAVCFAMIGITILAMVILTLVFKNKPYETRIKLMMVLSIVNVCIFFGYKIALAWDPGYIAIMYPDGKYNFLAELPFHFCTSMIILMPFSLKMKSDVLRSYCGVFGLIALILTIVSPADEMIGYNLFTFRCLGYFSEHMLLATCAVLMFTLDLFKPRFKAIPKHVLIVIAIGLCAHIINFILIKTGLAPEADYFFTMGTTKSALVQTAWSLIPIKFFYMVILGAPVLALFDLVVTSIQKLCLKIVYKDKLDAKITEG